jgi:hypothetical protein
VRGKNAIDDGSFRLITRRSYSLTCRKWVTLRLLLNTATSDLAKILDIDENVAKIVKTSVYKVDVDVMK